MSGPPSAAVEIADAPEERRLEARLDGALAGFLTYHRRPGQIALVHTEVGEAFAGRGVGGALVGHAVGRAREEGVAVLPFCPFTRDWIARHPEQMDLVPADRRAEFGLPAAA